MVSLAHSLRTKYGTQGQEEEEETQEDLVVILVMSSSPESKAGMLPSMMTLNRFHISVLGDVSRLELRHVRELDLAGNLISSWTEVLNILRAFPSLAFLNLAQNLLARVDEGLEDDFTEETTFNLSKLVLNCNHCTWSTVRWLLQHLPHLTELHLSTNHLGNPGPEDTVTHTNLRHLYLSCNPVSCFSSLTTRILCCLPSLESLSLAECPISQLPPSQDLTMFPPKLTSLNLSNSEVSSVKELDRLRLLPQLRQLRLLGSPVLSKLEDSRAEVIARLPNISVLNGGDAISENEREDAERAFVRQFLDKLPGDRPDRVEQLLEKHGKILPLVKVDLTPTVFFQVLVFYGQESRQLEISVRQRVRHFKRKLSGMFQLPAEHMKLWYYDQELSQVTGPEEMKWPKKGLYTLNIRSGDYFVIEHKPMRKMGKQKKMMEYSGINKYTKKEICS